MELALLTYNVFLLILYSIATTLTFIFYRHTKKPLYLYAAILFVFCIFDDLIIFMTEFIDWFADLYNQIFMSVPTCKTIIFAVTQFCMIRIASFALQKKRIYPFYILLAACTLIWLFVPIMPDGAMKVYIYYLPEQISSFAISIYALYVLKQNSEFYDVEFLKEFRRIALWTAIFSLLIVAEDSIVIFNFDTYTAFETAINNRSRTCDIMYIGYAVFAIVKLIKMFHISSVDEVRMQEIPPVISHDTSQDGTSFSQDIYEPYQTSNDSPNKRHADQYSKFYLFCKEYQLTSREQDIFALLLKNKNNQEISDELVISIGTAKTHAHNIFQKVGVAKRQQLLDFYDRYQS
ncbi:MAG: helix-turn-helix transcriptional regulator [Ruminococcus sp.]|nr:helix-turn-helix transcriptional regulator [Ruminococcus sp.]